MPLMEGHVRGFAVTIDFHIKTGTQCVDHRRAHTVQATDRVIGRIAELGARVQLGQDNFHAG